MSPSHPTKSVQPPASAPTMPSKAYIRPDNPEAADVKSLIQAREPPRFKAATSSSSLVDRSHVQILSTENIVLKADLEASRVASETNESKLECHRRHIEALTKELKEAEEALEMILDWIIRRRIDLADDVDADAVLG